MIPPGSHVPDGRDYYSPEEERRRFIQETKSRSSSELFKDRLAVAFGGTVLVVVWIGTALLVLVIGAAILKWAFEEIAR